MEVRTWQPNHHLGRGKGMKHEYEDYIKWIDKQVKEQLHPIPPITEPKNFGAIVEAKINVHRTPKKLIRSPFKCDTGLWYDEDGNDYIWSELINPTIISEGVEN
jgi:hypothetical protein